MIYKVSNSNRIKAVSSNYIIAIVLVALLFLTGFQKSIFFILLSVWLLDAVSFLIHFQYLSVNKDDQFEFFSNAIIHQRNGQKETYYSEEISKIVVFLSTDMSISGLTPFISASRYKYANVLLKNGKNIVLTSLLSPEIEKVIKTINEVDIEFRTKYLCFITSD